ncbi:hypothetical protein WJX79_008687 [Trebouxia sp. C0005]
MSARRLNQAIVKRLQKGPGLKQPVLVLQKQNRSLHGAASVESAIQTPVQQLSQWDMASVALDVVESQLPQWTNRNTLDWSAQKELSSYQPQMQLKSASNGGLPILTKFTIEERQEQIEVQPLWIVVHQETPDGVARLYETVHTLYPEVLDHISDMVEPFCITDKNSMTFSKPHFSHGPWKGYLVGVVGDVAAHEDDALWPNRLFSDKRVMHNVRHGWDIAKFLAEPKFEDIAGHHSNLKLLQEDRQYQLGWLHLNHTASKRAFLLAGRSQAVRGVAEIRYAADKHAIKRLCEELKGFLHVVPHDDSRVCIK